MLNELAKKKVSVVSCERKKFLKSPGESRMSQKTLHEKVLPNLRRSSEKLPDAK